MADLSDLTNVLEEEEAAASEIPTSSLTEFEKNALKSQGIDVSGPTVRVRRTPPRKLAPVEPVNPPSKEEIRKLESPADVAIAAPVVVETPREPTFTKQDAQEYVRCLLSLKPFKKTYMVMGGNVQVTFSSRTAQESLILSTLLRDLRVRSGVGNSDIINVSWLAFQFCYTATQVVVGGNVLEVKKPTSLDYEAIREQVAETLKRIPLPIYKQLVNQMLVFELLTSDLEAKADDPNFWQPTDA